MTKPRLKQLTKVSRFAIDEDRYPNVVGGKDGKCHMLDICVYQQGGEAGFPDFTLLVCARCGTVNIDGKKVKVRVGEAKVVSVMTKQKVKRVRKRR